MDAEVFKSNIVEGLRQIGGDLTAMPTNDQMLTGILTEARRLTRAQAGSLFIRRGTGLRFSVAQNDTLPQDEIDRVLLGARSSLASDSLAAHVIETGEVLNVPDAYAINPQTGLQHGRILDKATGYRTQSLLAIPLKRIDGRCVGVLELINHLGPDGQVQAFPQTPDATLATLTAVAAMTIDNTLLQEGVFRAQLDTILRLSLAAEFRDNCTAKHIKRVSETSRILATALGMNPQAAAMIHWAAPMHDVGKIGISDTILLKPGILTREERQTIQQHTVIGAAILKDPGNPLMRIAHDVALWHHERWDGRGYPHNLRGDKIAKPARIVALADAFDAMVSHRCYKDPLPLPKAVSLVQEEAGNHFDPAVVTAFTESLKPILANYQYLEEELKAA